MGPCEWGILPTCPEWVAVPDPGSEQETMQQRAETLAVGLLWRLTGRVFGVCPVTVRPCFSPPDAHTTYRGRDTGAGPSSWPGLLQGSWASGPCGCNSGCGCIVPTTMLALPGPVVSVTEVREDGVVLDPTAYLIKDNRWLLRVGAPWPQTQDLTAADDEPGAFVVSYLKGVVVPEDGRYAAGDLACEFLRGMLGGDCALPARAVSVARQGVEIQLLDPAQYLDGGMTGIPSVDQWVKTINPMKARSRPRVFNPDTMGEHHRIRPGS